MTDQQLNAIQTWFAGFVDSLFDVSLPRPPPIVLKLEHTRHVAEHARQIAIASHGNHAAILMAEAVGWLHDVGRFSQFAEFGHFHDITSINHAERSWLIVRDADILSSLDENERRCLLDAIRHHNARIIPARVHPDCLPLLKLLRDADKLDIYRVVIEGLHKDGFRELNNMWPHIDLEGPVTPRVLEAARTEKNCSIAHLRSLADFILLQISWVYEFHYPSALEYVARKNILDTLEAYLPDEEGPREIVEKARRFIARHKKDG